MNNLGNKSSPRTIGRRSGSNVTTPQKQQTSPHKSPRSAKKNETEGDMNDYSKTSVEIAENKDDLESPKAPTGTVIDDNNTPQRKPSPFEALQILSPVQELTEV